MTMKLNAEQQAAVDFVMAEDSGNLVVKALAGTGKTTLLCAIASVLEGSVYICAFGKGAADNIKSRLRVLMPTEDLDSRSPRIKISTTNSLGMSTWMRANPGSKVQLVEEKVRLLAQDQAQRQPLAAKYPGFICQLVSYAKRSGFGVLCNMDKYSHWIELARYYNLTDTLPGDDDVPELVNIAMGIYKVSLDRCRRTIDFDDQILAPMYYEARFQRYRTVLLDEAQDTSPMRLEMVMQLLTSDGRFIAVGDENQSIMGFTGAHNNAMGEIIKMTNAEVLPLNTTFRVPKSGVRLAQEQVPQFAANESNIEGNVLHANMSDFPRKGQELTVETLMATLREVESERPTVWGFTPFTKDDAILCRNTRPLVELAYQMIRRRIPCRVEGRNIGQGLISLARRWSVHSLYDLDDRVYEYKRRESGKLMGQFKEAEAQKVIDQCDTLTCLIRGCMEDGKTSVYELCQFITSIFGDTPEGQEPPHCTLTTVHKAKGKEWRRVFVLGLYDLMPSPFAKQPWELKQEQNLIYVAKTRHKETLVIVHMPQEKEQRNGTTTAETQPLN